MNYHKGNKLKKRTKLYQKIWFQISLLIILIGTAACLTYGISFLKIRQNQAQEFDLNAISKLEIPSRIYDRDGIEIGQIKIEDRRPIRLDAVPYHLIQALTAVEDSRFFEHSGVDFIGIARAVVLNLKAKRITQGASTITQQLAKQCYPVEFKTRNINTKIIEAFLANRIESSLTKPEILEHYLNRIYFGSGYFGIESASRGYFGKSVADINILEAATICGLIKNPSRLSPRNNMKLSLKARNHVLNRMYKEKMITESKLSTFLDQPIQLSQIKGEQNSYVQEMVRLQVIKQIGLDNAGKGGLKIYTTIDNETQKVTMQSLYRNLTKTESHPEFKHQTYANFQEKEISPDPIALAKKKRQSPDYLQGAVIMIENTTGGIVALVGGRNFKHSQFNRALQSKRPTGTAFKPFVYAAAFSENYFPGSMIKDSPIDNRSVAIGGSTGILGEWGSESETVTYKGTITAREALVESKNSATVRIGKKIGRSKVVDLVQKAGVKSAMDEYDKTLLGSSSTSLHEICRAFTIFPNGGQTANHIHIISSIINPKGEKIFISKNNGQEEVIDRATAYLVHSCLKDSLSKGTGKEAFGKYGLRDKYAAGKTGTAYNFTDHWFVGYNSAVTCGVWAGFDTPKTIYRGAFSKDTIMPVWVDAMNTSLKSFPSKPINQPTEVLTIEICKKSGLRATDTCYEEMAGEEEGTRKITRTTYKEIIQRGADFHSYCQFHANGNEQIRKPIISDLTNSDNRSQSISSIDAVFLISPTVIGESDPYSSLKPVLKARAVDEKEISLKATPVTPTILGNGESPIQITPPKPLEIPDID
ncbi:transglycosylase domain-containing protein [Verrucomicrobia bacterium]|nr:transglycosylase domain-containing protein [Verrucomicrobiota bacterium]